MAFDYLCIIVDFMWNELMCVSVHMCLCVEPVIVMVGRGSHKVHDCPDDVREACVHMGLPMFSVCVNETRRFQDFGMAKWAKQSDQQREKSLFAELSLTYIINGYWPLNFFLTTIQIDSLRRCIICTHIHNIYKRMFNVVLYRWLHLLHRDMQPTKCDNFESRNGLWWIASDFWAKISCLKTFVCSLYAVFFY